MKGNCINTNLQEYKDLRSQFYGDDLLLEAIISYWQTINKTDTFPTIDQINRLDFTGKNYSDFEKLPREYEKYSLGIELSNKLDIPLNEAEEVRDVLDSMFISDGTNNWARFKSDVFRLFDPKYVRIDENKKSYDSHAISLIEIFSTPAEFNEIKNLDLGDAFYKYTMGVDPENDTLKNVLDEIFSTGMTMANNYTIIESYFKDNRSYLYRLPSLPSRLANEFTRGAKMRVLMDRFSSAEVKERSIAITNMFRDIVNNYMVQPEYINLDRISVIKEITPARIFKEIRHQLENIRKANRDALPLIKNPNRRASIENILTNLDKLLENDNFDLMALYSSTRIGNLEGISFKTDGLSVAKYIQHEASDIDVSNSEQLNDFFQVHEEMANMAWQNKWMHKSIGDAMTTTVKNIIGFIEEKDNDGKTPLYDSIGFKRKLNSDIVKNKLTEHLKDMTTSLDLIPMLEKASGVDPWIKSIITEIQNDDVFATQFYNVFRTDFTNYGIVVKTLLDDGTYSYKTPMINESDSYNYYLSMWSANLNNGTIISIKRSLYNGDKSVNLSRVDKNMTDIETLQKGWETITKGNNAYVDRVSFIDDNAILIKELLGSVGINTSEMDLKSALRDATDNPETKLKVFRLNKLLENLLNVNRTVKNNKITNAVGIFDDNNNNFKSLAEIFVKSDKQMVESVVNENKKSYYSYSNPSYLGKLIKELKNVRGDEKAFNDFIDKEFRQYDGLIYNPTTKEFLIDWLNDLVDLEGVSNKSNRDKFDRKVQLNFDKVDYDALDEMNYSLSLLTEYFSNKEYTYYHVPIMSNSPVSEFIKFKRYTGNFRKAITDRLMNLFTYEWNRINSVDSINQNSDIKIDNFNERGKSFVFMPFLNQYLPRLKEVKNADNTLPVEVLNEIKNIIGSYLEDKAGESKKYLESIGLLNQSNGKYIFLDKLGIDKNNIDEMLKQYFYNSWYATANIIQLTNTDLAFSKNIEDFQKRNKQIHAPGKALYNGAKYNNYTTPDTYNAMYISDNYIKASFLDSVVNMFANNTKMSNYAKASILSKHGYNNVKSFRKNNKTFVAVTKNSKLSPNIKKGYYIDINNKLEPISKEVYLNNLEGSKENQYILVNDNGINSYFQTKLVNTTDGQSFRTLKSYRDIMIKQGEWNDSLEETYNRLNRNEFDWADWNNFLQAVKPFMFTHLTVNAGVGNLKLKVPTQHKNSEVPLIPAFIEQYGGHQLKGILDGMKSSGTDVIHFESVVKVGKFDVLDSNEFKDADITKQIFDNNKNKIHTINYEDLIIQQPISDHLQDYEQLFGSQPRKLIQSDIDSNVTIDVAGVPMSKDTWAKLYNDTIIENQLESYTSLMNDFSDVRKLQTIIENEVFTNERYSTDLIQACQLNEEGTYFVMPLSEPIQSNRIQQLLNSIVKSRITKQMIKGGKVTQVSSYGLSNNLKVVIENGTVKYYECLITWPSNDIPSSYIDENTGIIDIEKIKKDAPEILDMIGYRIPTEDKYSMMPLKIVGFLPRNSGANIMLPMEITTITGSDFDIDAIYLMIKEFSVMKDSIKYLNYKNKRGKIPDPMDMPSSKQRNNLLIDMFWGVLTNKDTAEKMMNPGGFDEYKRAAYISYAIENGRDYNELKNIPLDELQSIFDDLRSSLDIMDFTTQIRLQKQNMSAASLIGVFANHNVNHALIQGKDIGINKSHIVTKTGTYDVDKIKIDGKAYNRLSDVFTTIDGFQQYISKNVSSGVAASVDAVKDPVLTYMNINTYTADAFLLLVRSGMSITDASIILNQPVVKDIVKEYELGRTRGISKSKALRIVRDRYENIIREELQSKPYSFIVDDKFFINDKPVDKNSVDLVGAIKDGIKLSNLTYMTPENRSKEFSNISPNVLKSYYNGQLKVLNLFDRILSSAQELADEVAATRSDTQNGGAGPTNGSNIMKIRRVLRNKTNSEDTEKAYLYGTDIVKIGLDRSNIIKLRSELRDSPLGFVQGFYTLGLEATEDIMGRFFIHYKPFMNYIFEAIEDITVNGRLNDKIINNIVSNFYAFHVNRDKDSFFYESDPLSWMNNFVSNYSDYVNSDDVLNSMQIFKSIRESYREDEMHKLKFTNIGNIGSQYRDDLILEWESLLRMDSRRFNFAQDMFKYCYLVNGFDFGSDSFIHMASTLLKQSIPGYIDRIRELNNFDSEELLTDSFVISTLNSFIDQYVLNNVTNRNLVPEVQKDRMTELNIDYKSDEITVPGMPLLTKDNGDMFNYFVIKDGSNEYYFKLLDTIVTDSGNNYIYSKVKPLGNNNQFLEYTSDSRPSYINNYSTGTAYNRNEKSESEPLYNTEGDSEPYNTQVEKTNTLNDLDSVNLDQDQLVFVSSYIRKTLSKYEGFTEEQRKELYSPNYLNNIYAAHILNSKKENPNISDMEIERNFVNKYKKDPVAIYNLPKDYLKC